jgi:hypothetical protein
MYLPEGGRVNPGDTLSDMAMNHPGFKAVQAKIAARQGISMDRAGAILAAGARHASAKAKATNPRLKKVSGAGKTGSSAGSDFQGHHPANHSPVGGPSHRPARGPKS